MFIRTVAVRYLTLGFASAITLYPLVLIAAQTQVHKRLVIHEKIHLRQQAEMLIIPFYICYLLEYAIGLLRYRNGYRAYRAISFEREAYAHEGDSSYLRRRPSWNWIHFLWKVKPRLKNTRASKI